MSERQQEAQNPAKGLPERLRWINLDAYGIKLKIALYKDGKMLVAENGEAHSEKLAGLGFSKIGGEWTNPEIGFAPRSIKAVFPEMVMEREKRSLEIVIDRLSQELPPEARSNARPSISRRIAESRDNTYAFPKTKVWFAEVIIGDHTVHAFGMTPEEAMRSLVESWTEHARVEHETVSLLSAFRGSIYVNPAETGKGYSIGISDSAWYKGGFNGLDSRFDAILAALPAPEPEGGPRP